MATKPDADRMLVVMTTVGSQEDADRLAEVLLAERLVACVTALPARSMYRWQGAVVREAEQLLLLKTPDAAWPRLEERIRELHPYEVPELVAVPAARVADGYLAWLLDSTSMTEV